MNIIPIILTIIIVFMILLYTYKKDYIEKEPKKKIILLFLLGFVSLILSKYILSIFLTFFPDISEEVNNPNTFVQIVISFGEIGFIEELSKWILLMIFIWKSKDFNYVYDAIVYSVCIALGFALLENIIYIINYENNALIFRLFFTIPVHATFGVISGFYIGKAKVFSKKKVENNITYNLFLNLFIPIIMHGLYDFILVKGIGIYAIIFIAIVIIYYIISIIAINSTNRIDYVLYEDK